MDQPTFIILGKQLAELSTLGVDIKNKLKLSLNGDGKVYNFLFYFIFTHNQLEINHSACRNKDCE